MRFSCIDIRPSQRRTNTKKYAFIGAPNKNRSWVSFLLSAKNKLEGNKTFLNHLWVLNWRVENTWTFRKIYNKNLQILKKIHLNVFQFIDEDFRTWAFMAYITLASKEKGFRQQFTESFDVLCNNYFYWRTRTTDSATDYLMAHIGREEVCSIGINILYNNIWK